MKTESPYSINLDAAFQSLELIDVGALAAAMQPWSNQTLCGVNDCVVRLGVVHGDFHWHKHDDQDEFFYVLEGRWIIELEGGCSVELAPGQGYLVPRGVLHFPRAPERTVILMIDGAGIVPTGD